MKYCFDKGQFTEVSDFFKGWGGETFM